MVISSKLLQRTGDALIPESLFDQPIARQDSATTGRPQGTLGNCSFCNSVSLLLCEIDAGVWAVYCSGCEAIGPHMHSPNEAVARWRVRR